MLVFACALGDPKVTKDFFTGHAAADTDEQKQRCIDDMKQRHYNYLKRKRTSSTTNWQPRKLFRCSAQQFLMGLDNQLKGFCGGLKDFRIGQTPVDDRGDPSTWPKLSIAADQGGDQLCGINALMRAYGCNVDFVPDPSHGIQNDLWLSGKQAGLSSFFYGMLLMVNVPFGPYCEDMRYKQVIQNLDALLQDSGDLGFGV